MKDDFDPRAVRQRLKAVFARHSSGVRVCGLLKSAGYQAWLVGGAVRDALLGRSVEDIDIATGARPGQVQSLAERGGFKTLLDGYGFGTVKFLIDGQSIEVTSFRKDHGCDGRHSAVTYSDTIEEDAKRRDFTINALYADDSGNLCDPLGALDDLNSRRIRFVGRPAARIREDYLRILRFFRFHAHFAGTAHDMDAPAVEAIRKHADGLRKVSRERIGAEMMKLLTSPSPSYALRQMDATGVLRRILPGAGTETLAELERLEQRFGLDPDAERRLAAIGAADPLASLRISRAMANRVATLRKQAMRTTPAGELGYRSGERAAVDICILRSALTGVPLTAGFREDIERAARQRFPVAAGDLIDSLQGKGLGDRLRLLEQRWIESGFVLTKEKLLALSDSLPATG